MLQSHVEHGIVQGTAHEEFQTEIVDALGIAECLALLGLVPLDDETITEGQTGGGVRSSLVAVEHAASQGSLDMTDDLSLKVVLVADGLDLVPPPCFTLGLGDRGCSDGSLAIVSRFEV